jgi:hypothetical protein
MAVIPHLITRYALVLYTLSALGAFFYVWSAFQARRRGGLALFAMERDNAVKQGVRAWMMAGMCVLLACGVYGVSTFIAPNLPLDQADATPAVALLATPTVSPTLPPTPTPVLSTATTGQLPTVAPIATPLARPPDTPTPLPPGEGGGPPVVAACTSAGTQIISPGNGDQVSGIVEVLGTASLPDFAFYKFEIQWPGSDEWVTVQSFELPVAGGVLGYWDTTLLAQEPGTYKFRLVVVDRTGNYPAPCVIAVTVEPSS